MAIESNDVPIGTVLPPFELPSPDGRTHNSNTLMGPKGLLVIFTCNHCPYARAVWTRTIALARHAREKGINTVAINPNIHPAYPEDAPEAMKQRIAEWEIPFPYLYDESQEIARAYGAQCTPDIYLFGGDRKLVYHGRVDDNWQDEKQVTRHDLRLAIDALAEGAPVSGKQYPTIGCSIKWR